MIELFFISGITLRFEAADINPRAINPVEAKGIILGDAVAQGQNCRSHGSGINGRRIAIYIIGIQIIRAWQGWITTAEQRICTDEIVDAPIQGLIFVHPVDVNRFAEKAVFDVGISRGSDIVGIAVVRNDAVHYTVFIGPDPEVIQVCARVIGKSAVDEINALATKDINIPRSAIAAVVRKEAVIKDHHLAGKRSVKSPEIGKAIL